MVIHFYILPFRLIEIENKFHNVMFKSTETSKRLLCKKIRLTVHCDVYDIQNIRLYESSWVLTN